MPIGGIDFSGIRFVDFSVRLNWNEKLKLFSYLVYFWSYSWTPLYFLVLFMGSTVLFQSTFTFIYCTFSNKFLLSMVSKHTLNLRVMICLQYIHNDKF